MKSGLPSSSRRGKWLSEVFWRDLMYVSRAHVRRRPGSKSGWRSANTLKSRDHTDDSDDAAIATATPDVRASLRVEELLAW
jgi:hypothetical protein